MAAGRGTKTTASAGTGLVVLELPLEQVRPFPGQPRRHFGRKAMAELETSIRAVGQQVPVIVHQVDGRFELIDGERRWRACKSLGLPTILAFVQPRKAEGSQFIASVVSNFARAGHTASEVIDAVATIEASADVQRFATVKERSARIAAIFGRSTAWVEHRRILQRLVPEARALLDEHDGGIDLPTGLLLAVLEPAKQRDLCRAITLRGLNRMRSAALVRKARENMPGVGTFAQQQPARVLERIMRGSSVISDKADDLGGQSAKALRNAIQTASPEQRTMLAEHVDAALENVQALHEVVHRLIREAS